jgi:regulator of protease activity HflC (stomatin/prohibitin superfamily)
MTFDLPMLAGVLLPPAALFLAILAFRRLIVFTPEAHELLRLRFGRLATRSTAAGVSGTRLAPHERWLVVSRQWDERIFRGIETNDAQGTMVKVVLRVTFRIADGERALFCVDDWEEALESATVHDAGARLAGRPRALFLQADPQLSAELTASMRAAMAPYGIEIRDVRILDVELRPEVARQMFEAVAAKLEVAKAEYEESGRTGAALLLARTAQRVAELEARARTESLKAVGRAYQELRARPGVFEAYTDLYRLSQIDPAKVVSFDGFAAGALATESLVESELARDDSARG